MPRVPLDWTPMNRLLWGAITGREMKREREHKQELESLKLYAELRKIGMSHNEIAETLGRSFAGEFIQPRKGEERPKGLPEGVPTQYAPTYFKKLAEEKAEIPDWEPGVIEKRDPKTNEVVQAPYFWGTKIPAGWTVVRPPQSVVKIDMGKPPAATERIKLAEGRASRSSLYNLRNLFDAKYVGPVKGRVGKVGDIFGLNPQEQSEFNAATAAFKNAIIVMITGAQMGEEEAKRIMKQVPDVNDPPTVWTAKWNQSLRNVDHLEREMLRVLEQSGLRVPTATPEPIQRPDAQDPDDIRRFVP